MGLNRTTSEFDAQIFTTARINRLLRPLRNRCISLANFAIEGCRSSIRMYSPRTSVVLCNDDPDSPPLSLLHPPMVSGTRVRFDKHHIESLEMARKVYGLRDCFQEIVSKIERKKPATMNGRRQRVLSLGALCSIIVGENMQCEADAGGDDVEGANVINGIYDAVPLEYRRFTLLSHAIKLILSTTIHHPTLLSILLNVTLAHGYSLESNTILRALLFVALSPMSTGARPPICHPTHSVFLLELRTRWTGSGFPEQTFYRILVDVLHVVQSPEAWRCKAVHKLAETMGSSDFLSFMELVRGCTSMACELDHSDRRKIRATKLKRQDTTYAATRLWTRLHEWLSIACDLCITVDDSGESSMEHCDAIYAVLELSLSAENVGIPQADLQGDIVCLATQWLSSPFILGVQSDSVIKRLVDITPQSSTYVTLIAKTFARLSLGLGQSKLESFAAALRSHDLLRLEASLWSCALHRIEHSTPGCLGSGTEVEEIGEYRDRLIDLVDDAEHRCFGVDAPSLDSNRVLSSDANVGASNNTTGRLHRQWQWEAMFGCWVRRDDDYPSVNKKRKVEAAETSCLPDSRSFRLRRNAKFMRSPSATIGRMQDGYMRGPVAEDSVRRRSSSQDGEEHGTRTGRDMRLPLEAWPSNFASLLADAFSERTALRDTPEKKPQARDIRPRLGICSLSPPSRSLLHSSKHQTNLLSSDDLLDLFVYQASSSA